MLWQMRTRAHSPFAPIGAVDGARALPGLPQLAEVEVGLAISDEWIIEARALAANAA
jgi:hypothetical protein